MSDKQVVHLFDQFDLERAIVDSLELRAEEASINNLRLVPLRDLVVHNRELVEATFSRNVASFIGKEEVGDPDAVIWAPSPLDQNWFERLQKEGHTGERILISSTADAKKDFEPFATQSAVQIPERNVSKRIFELLSEI